ncbi:hypothetical protein TIFTF001_008591 [Ficus carica]|uniref:Uncharacterized protein n=1 Tax=Ficus carica TaxID=3494 RepID=A0AA87ZTA3_FICCA|nr:hypothetical protein TIFTF001_008591 [Ficus carica]
MSWIPLPTRDIWISHEVNGPYTPTNAMVTTRAGVKICALELRFTVDGAGVNLG